MPAATVRPGATLALKGRDADVWAWNERIEVACEGCGGCKDVHLRVNSANVPLTAMKGGGYADVALREGKNRIVAVCVDAAGNEHLSDSLVVYTARLEDRPVACIRASNKGNRVAMDSSHSEPSEGSRAPIRRYSWSLPRNVRPARRSSKRIAVESPKRDGEYYASLSVTDKSGKIDTSSTYFVVQGGIPRVPDLDTENPAWVESAVVYGVIPFLFGDKPLQSVTAKLEYLRRLGINAIWLSPINVSSPGDYGYAATDYFDIRPDYGIKADFRELVGTAHSKGIRVLMDFASNDTSDQHPYFKDAQAHGTVSHYYDFYDRDKDGKPTHYFDWTDNVGQWSWDGIFDHEATLGYALGAALTNGDTGYDPDALIFRFLNNNDTGVRFVDAYSVEMTRVAAMLLTLPGVPCLYTGDEIGAQYLPYETTSPIEWNDRHGLREYYRKLIALRMEVPSLHSRNWTLLRSHPGGQTLSYLRHVGDAGMPVLVVLSYGSGTTAGVTLPESFGAFSGGGVLMDKLSGERVEVHDSRHLDIPTKAWTARILVPGGRS